MTAKHFVSTLSRKSNHKEKKQKNTSKNILTGSNEHYYGKQVLKVLEV